MGIQIWQERVTRQNDSAERGNLPADQEPLNHSETKANLCSFCDSRHQGFQQDMASRHAPVEWLVVVDDVADNANSKELTLKEQSNQLMRGVLQAANVGKTAMVLPVGASQLKTAQSCCRQSLLDDISTIQPTLVFMFGENVSTSLLVKTKPTGKEGALTESMDGLTCPVIVTCDLSELLENPLLKKKVWTDIQLALSLKN